MLQNFIKIISLETIPLKSRVNGFLKRNIQEYIFQYRVFTKSIISHLFLKHFHLKNNIYKITSPSYGVKEETADRCRTTSAQFQRKRKSLVFFQSIFFGWGGLLVAMLCEQVFIKLLSHKKKLGPKVS
jgi:hypothetical protein